MKIAPVPSTSEKRGHKASLNLLEEANDTGPRGGKGKQSEFSVRGVEKKKIARRGGSRSKTRMQL